NNIFQCAILVVKTTAFLLFAFYLHYEFMSVMLTKVAAANKKQEVIERSIDYEVKKRVIEIERVNENLVKKTKTDSMTKVLNKVAIYDAIENQIVTRPKMDFSLIMLDIDNFKHINDTLGHLTGDKCIKTVALLTRNSFRDFDIIGRYGGDEFLVLLPGTNASNAIQVAERLRKKVEEQSNPKITLSIGIATYPDCGTTVKELLEVADEGLYRSKEKGRNAVSYLSIY
ncbi:MAG: diguanylate cyclase, partial [Clostridiales bacterium]|nr:diguanylate cyclase [Clostridiales bacterium]